MAVLLRLLSLAAILSLAGVFVSASAPFNSGPPPESVGNGPDSFRAAPWNTTSQNPVTGNSYTRPMPASAPDKLGPAPTNASANSTENVTAPNPNKKVAQNTTNAPVLANLTDAGGLDLNSTTIDGYNLSLIFKRPVVTTTTTTSIPDYCGRTAVYCSVENDNDADEMPDCCDEGNNPVCKGCLSECIVKCAALDVGVRTCFVAKNIGPICQCGLMPPNCYDMPVITTTTMAEVISPGGDNSLVYVLVGAVLLAGAAVAVKFSHGAGGV